MASEQSETETLETSVLVTSVCWFLEDQSSPEERRFVFSYTITVHNRGEQAAQLMTRHWLITDADGKKQEVHGDGVIGEQPIIAAGEKHTYSSGAVIETPVGTMEGRYGMVAPDGTEFNATIPVFRLAVPGVLN